MSEPRRVNPEIFAGIGEGPALQLELEGDDETRRLGELLAGKMEAGDFVGLVGDLGAGKTTLMQGVVAAIDTTNQWRATSPTYSLIQVYETTPPIFHIDLYRLEGLSDLESIGYWDYVESRRGITCVEWLDKIPGAWPEQGLIIELTRHDGARMARLWADESWSATVAELDLSILK